MALYSSGGLMRRLGHAGVMMLCIGMSLDDVIFDGRPSHRHGRREAEGEMR